MRDLSAISLLYFELRCATFHNLFHLMYSEHFCSWLIYNTLQWRSLICSLSFVKQLWSWKVLYSTWNLEYVVKTFQTNFILKMMNAIGRCNSSQLFFAFNTCNSKIIILMFNIFVATFVSNEFCYKTFTFKAWIITDCCNFINMTLNHCRQD